MYKIAIVGAGVIGALVARKLTCYETNIVILEKSNDVAMGQSKANSGIVHAGFDPEPGTLKAKLNVKGSKMMEETCRDLDVKYRRNGTLVCGFDEDDKIELEKLYERGITNGVEGLELIDADQARKLEKNLSKNVRYALLAKTGGIVCPYELTIHAVGCAMENGAELRRNFEVSGITNKGAYYDIISQDGETIQAEIIINAAGIHSDEISKMAGFETFHIQGRKGEYLLLDKEAGDLVDMTIFRVPGKMGKGVLASKTVDGNIILGPTSVTIDDKENREVTQEGLMDVLKKEGAFFDKLPLDKVITEFTGIRAHGDRGDFVIEMPEERFLNLGACESPGLTASPAIALMVLDMLLDRNLISKVRRPDYTFRYKKSVDFRSLRNEEKNELIKKNPSYGRTVCRCEGITEGEITEAIRRNPKALDVDGVKRRTRAGMGRCQGGFCLSVICEILSKELGVPIDEVTKQGEDSDFIKEATKGKPSIRMEKTEFTSFNDELYDVVVIGGGPAGMAAAASAKEEGAEKILIVEREPRLGGILEQCIHAGFGLKKFKEELTGPEYGERYEKMVYKQGIMSLTETMVLDLIKKEDGMISVTCSSKEHGYFDIRSKSVVLAMGCREKTRGALMIPGTRPAGVYTAGTAQKFVNIMGYMPGKRVVILGSGDIGLIMARRMTLEGAKVEAVLEIMKDSGGLTRNIIQCLRDYDIPLKLSHTVTKIHGDKRVTGVTVSKVDDSLNPILGTEEYIECDTLLLSVGLIPENELSKKAGVEIDKITRGPVVDYNKMTSVSGIFACGNVVRVHELVDYVSQEGEIAGRAAGLYALGKKIDIDNRRKIEVKSQPKGVQNLSDIEDNVVICTVCPNGCRIVVNGDAFEGNLCERGKKFAFTEMTKPERTLTSTVMSREGKAIPVKSERPVPKELMREAIKELSKVDIELPISIGDIIIKNVLNSGIDIICTRSIE